MTKQHVQNDNKIILKHIQSLWPKQRHRMLVLPS